MRDIMRMRDTGESGKPGPFGRTECEESEVAVSTPEVLHLHNDPDTNSVFADIAPERSPIPPGHRTWHLDRDQAEEYVVPVDAPAARFVVEAAEGWQYTVTERGEIEAIIDRGDGQPTSIGSFGKDTIGIGMSGWGENLFDSEQVRYDELEVDTSDQGSNLRARATVTLPDGMEVDVNDFDTTVAVQDWSPDGVRSVLRDASDERVLEDLTRLAAWISRSPRGKCHRPRRQPR